jgi:hypothetical protein
METVLAPIRNDLSARIEAVQLDLTRVRKILARVLNIDLVFLYTSTTLMNSTLDAKPSTS